LSRDPILYRHSTNLYEYVGARPTTEVDPYGLQHYEPGTVWCQSPDKTQVTTSPPASKSLIGTLKKNGWDCQTIGAGGHLPPPPPQLNSYLPQPAPRFPPGLKICQRDIKEQDIYDTSANSCGGQHTFFVMGPLSPQGGPMAGTVGVGFGGGSSATAEDAFRPTQCRSLSRDKSCTLAYGEEGGSDIGDVSDSGIYDCLAHVPPSRPYNWYSYNCYTWAQEAMTACCVHD
jgi:hypothetical protein